MHRWFQQCPSCKVALSVRLLPRDRPVAMDQLHGRLHRCGIILFLKSWNDREKENIIVAGVRDESLHRRHFMNDHDKENLISASRAAVQIAPCWYGHPVRYRSSCVWCKHIKVFEFQVEHNKPWIVSGLYHSFLTPSLALWATLRISCIPILVRGRTSCALIVCWWSSTAFQFISSSQRQKSPGIFINSLTRCRNFRVSQSLAIGRGFRITRGAYLITMKQCPESSSVFDDIMRTRMSLVILLIRFPALVYVTFICSNVTRFVARASPRPFWCHQCIPPRLHEINIRTQANVCRIFLW